jgi:hypothetical protein
MTGWRGKRWKSLKKLLILSKPLLSSLTKTAGVEMFVKEFLTWKIIFWLNFCNTGPMHLQTWTKLIAP